MEVNVDVPKGFDNDEDHAHIYNPDMERFEDEEQEEEPPRHQQPIYYEVPERYESYKERENRQDGGSLMNNINPLVWMVIVFVAFILGFFMGMGSGGKGGSQAPIILAPRGNM